MSKDINIHIKTKGADQTKQQLGGIGQSAKQVGNDTAKANQKAGGATDQTTEKLKKQGGTLVKLGGQVKTFIGAWLGLQGVMKLASMFTEKLERIQQLQKSIYEQSVSMMEVGQSLEFQTGTVGKAPFWAKQAGELTAAGGLKEGVAGQMLTSMDIAFAAQGGIKNAEVRNLGKELAPFVGTAGFSSNEVAKLFEFAGTAGVEPNVEAYRRFFGQLQAGYTSSKSTQGGEFLTGLQKGGTAYMSMGGSLTQAISAFSAAKAVMPTEALAATLLEQTARLSGGGYEKPRMNIEESLGVKWSDLSMDQRMDALLMYVKKIPENERAQTLAEAEFPLELTTQLGKMVSPEAMTAMETTRQAVTSADSVMVNAQSEAYMDSILGRSRTAAARRGLQKLGAGPAYARWQERLENARTAHEILVARGNDRLSIPDDIEPYIMAEEELVADMKAAGMEDVAEDLTDVIKKQRRAPNITMFQGYDPRRIGATFEAAYQGTIIQNQTIYTPRVGSDGRGPRVGRDFK